MKQNIVHFIRTQKQKKLFTTQKLIVYLNKPLVLL